MVELLVLANVVVWSIAFILLMNVGRCRGKSMIGGVR